MGTKDPRIDAYIGEANPFARPILTELRRRMHAHVPEIEESLRWSAPTFLYKGKILAGMAAFKAHCVFGFWHPLMRLHDNSLEGRNDFGRMETVADLPMKSHFVRQAKEAVRLVDENVKAPPKPKAAPKPVVVPGDLATAFKRNAKARATFEGFPPSARKEYVDWIVGAKREETRAERLATALEWLAEGKRRHWKYEKC
jgi:hypothetical protein